MNNQNLEERISFLDKRIKELADKIQYSSMNQYEYEECVDERKELLKEYNQLIAKQSSIQTEK